MRKMDFLYLFLDKIMGDIGNWYVRNKRKSLTD